MGEGDDPLVEHGDARRRRRIGAQQDLSRARADLENAGSGGPDPEIAIRLEVIEQELTVLRRQAGARSRKRDERRVLDLLLSERLLLEQLGFTTYDEYVTWCGGDVSAEETDLAYLEFARMQLESAQRQLDAIESSELDPSALPATTPGAGELEPYLVIPAREADEPTPADTRGDPLEAWVAHAPAGEDATSADDGSLPHLGTTDLDDLHLPYWDETA